MKISQEALDAARSIGSYCGSRFQQDVSAMLDVPWFAEKVQIAIDASMPAAPTPQPITAAWLREQGWEEDEDSEERSFWTIDLDTCFGVELSVVEGEDPLLYLCFGYPQGNIPLRPVTDTADLANLVAALRGGGA